jgi:hypothetical protein
VPATSKATLPHKQDPVIELIVFCLTSLPPAAKLSDRPSQNEDAEAHRNEYDRPEEYWMRIGGDDLARGLTGANRQFHANETPNGEGENTSTPENQEAGCEQARAS